VAVFLLLSALLCLTIPFRFGGAQADDTIDFTQPQSPPKPAPTWLKIIDQGTHDPRLKGYFTPEGIKVEIVAEEPTVINPVGMTFADDGTPYVLEWRHSPGDNWHETPETFTYKDGTKRNVATMKKKIKDVVKVLKNASGKGTYDRAKVILEDELPSSILLHDGWIYLSGRGTVRRFKQKETGGAYTSKEVIAQGFCGFHHHQVSGLTIGNDGWLYITSGDDDNYVEGSDGSRATVLRTGAVFRCRPDGSRMQTFARGFRNPYRDVAFDAQGNMFHADNDNEDGGKFTGCRIMHITEGCDFGWRLHQGAGCRQPDKVRGAVSGELPGKMPPLLKTGRGAPAGLLIYKDTRFPENYRGLLYYPDVFRKSIRAYKVEPQGATFAVTEEFVFLKSDDPLFRPCQMVLGPDGAMYIVDWRTDSGGAGRLSGDGVHGRVYRVSWVGTKEQPALPPRPMDSWMKIRRLSDEDLLKTLASDEASFRTRAQRELIQRGDRNLSALRKLLLDSEQPLSARIAALGALQSFWNAEVQQAFQQTLVSSAEEPLRRLAAEGLGLNAPRGDKETQVALLKALNDNDLAIRRAAALAMGRLAAPGAADALVNTLAFDDSQDLYLRDGLVRAIESLGKPGIHQLLALAESGVKAETDRVVDAFAMLRSRAGYEGLPSLLKYPHLTIEQRTKLIRSCGNYLLDPPISLEPIIAELRIPKASVGEVEAVAELLSVGGTLRSKKIDDWLLELLTKPVDLVRDGVIEKAAASAYRLAAIKAFASLGERSAVPAIKQILKEKAMTPDARRLCVEALRALAALDRKEATFLAQTHLKKNDDLLIEAITVMAATPEGTRILAQRFLDKQLPREILPRIADALRKHAGKDAALGKMLAEIMKMAPSHPPKNGK